MCSTTELTDDHANISPDPRKTTWRSQVQQLKDMGINHLHVRFMGEIDGETAHISKSSAELFAEAVMPRFAETRPAPQPAFAAAK